MVSAMTEPSSLTAAARIDLVLSDRWVAYPQGQAALQRLEELLRGAQRTRMPSLLIVGDPDVGKTTILRKFMRGRSPSFDSETGRSRMEVVAIEAPPEADERRLYGAILDAIGAPVPARRAMEAERAVHGQLQRLRTRLLVIDETNNLMIGTGAAQRKTLAALRRLSNTLSLAMAYFGTLEALNALTSDPSRPALPARAHGQGRHLRRDRGGRGRPFPVAHEEQRRQRLCRRRPRDQRRQSRQDLPFAERRRRRRHR